MYVVYSVYGVDVHKQSDFQNYMKYKDIISTMTLILAGLWYLCYIRITEEINVPVCTLKYVVLYYNI